MVKGRAFSGLELPTLSNFFKESHSSHLGCPEIADDFLHLGLEMAFLSNREDSLDEVLSERGDGGSLMAKMTVRLLSKRDSSKGRVLAGQGGRRGER